MGFRENLKRLREVKGWTQAQAADHAGVPFRSYQNWESGLREPRLDALARLAAAFSVSADDLLEGVSEGAESPPEAAPEPPKQSEDKKPKRRRE